MYQVERYTKQIESQWNDFVTHSKQGTFLFSRAYMDYHKERFQDCSLCIYKKNKLVALLPACIDDAHTLISHQGLTYGGLITAPHIKTTDVLDIFQNINDYAKSIGICSIVYKAIPHIYHRFPAEEDLYALTQVCNAQLICREISSAIFPGESPDFEESRRSGIRKARKFGIECRPSDDMDTFWKILENNLMTRHQVHPVHTISEIRLLKSSFPKNIRLYAAFEKEQMLGGTLIYDTGRTIHTQYISASEEGKAKGALDILFHYLIQDVFADRPCIDFGKSTEMQGKTLNTQLIFQKEGFGARGICYDTYRYFL